MVKVDCAELEVLRKRADVNLGGVFVAGNNDIFDHDRSTIGVASLVQTNVELLESQAVLAANCETLLDLQRFELAVLNLDDRLQDIDAGGFEPGVTPLSEVEVVTKGSVSAPLIRLGETGDEVGERSVAPLVSLEVEVEAGAHGFVPKYVVELL